MNDNAKADGHSLQYQTLARALGYAAGLMEDDFEEAADVGRDETANGLRMEARYVTVTLLAAAMSECLANTLLSLATDGRHLKETRKSKDPLSLWRDHLPEVLGCAKFLSGKLAEDLALLINVRNAVTHSSPRLYSGDEVIDHGNSHPWQSLNKRNVRMFVGLPLRLLESVPAEGRPKEPVEIFAADHWLMQAIARGRGEPGRSYNVWRPETKEDRLREIREKRLR